MSQKHSSKSSGKPTPARGRPEGSFTGNILAVHTVRPTCRNVACGSSDLKRKAITRDMEHHRPASGDVPATSRRRWTRSCCRKCGAWQDIIEDYNP